MKHRERMLMALNHEKPDRCPMYSSFTPEFASRLREDMEMRSDMAYNPHGGGNPYDIEMALDLDMLLTSVGWANSYYQGDENTDEWGVGWKSQEYDLTSHVGGSEIPGYVFVVELS